MLSPSKTRQATALALLLFCAACSTGDVVAPPHEQAGGSESGIGRLDPSHAFYYPADMLPVEDGRVLAETSIGEVREGQLRRYQAGRGAAGSLDDLIFDLLLVAECRERGLGAAAPLLARSAAAQRYLASGRKQESSGDRKQQRKFANDALRNNRIDALVRADRKIPEPAIRALFERRYGPGGRRLLLCQIFLSFKSSAEQLRAMGKPSDRAAAKIFTAARAEAICQQLQAGESFTSLLSESDHAATRAALADPETVASAGQLWDTELQRLGSRVTGAFPELDIGEVSGLLESRVGIHLFQVLRVKSTDFDEVEEQIQRELLHGPASESEVRDLRRSLARKYSQRVLR